MRQKGFLVIILGLVVTLVIIVSALVIWLFSLDKTIQERLHGKRFLPPIEFYSAPLKVVTGQKLISQSLQSSLVRQRYNNVVAQKRLQPGEFAELDFQLCQSNLTDELPKTTSSCLLIAKKTLIGTPADNAEYVLVAFSADGVALATYSGEPLAKQNFVELEPVLFAQFVGPDPIMRELISLGDVPPQCLTSLLAIEDSQFLEHHGVSVTGILRAFVTNILKRRTSQGGSTITQQLVKNYFLTPEKTFKRKFTEVAMAFLLEVHSTKDDILETYVNEIYMGQNGPFQIRGFGAASHYYFGKDISQLELSDCALLAALVNSPGLYSPFTKPQNATKRRNLVLSRMVELKLLSEQERAIANVASLPQRAQNILTEPAPYFVDAVRRNLEQMNVDLSNGLRVFTTLDLQAQEAASNALREGVTKIESENKVVKKILAATHKNLEGSFVSTDPQTGDITALVGGRNFKLTQFNRIVQANRQVGSIFKPLVYLTALEKGINGQPITPLTPVDDTRFIVKYEKQVWSPINYDKKENGRVPAFFALSHSLNIATSSLALQVGLPNIIEVARDLGIHSNLAAVPSLALGAFEMTPFEVAQVYSTLARFGERVSVHLIRRLENLDGNLIFQYVPDPVRVSNLQDTAVLIGMMKQTTLTGTAWFLSQLGFSYPAAGKTGTTSDTKDAWFAGFTPHHLAVVWVGYDDNTESGLTGASGAVPIWAQYMKQIAARYPPDDFLWPDGVEKYTLSVESQIDLNIPEEGHRELQPMELIFKSGTTPTSAVSH